MSEDAHFRRPVPVRPSITRWHDEGGVTWLQTYTDQGWRKVNFMGDNVEPGDDADRRARYAKLLETITHDWRLQ